MSFIRPEKILERRLGGGSRPPWKKALVCFRDAKASAMIAEYFAARPLKYKLLWGMEVDPDRPFVYEMDLDGEACGLIARCNWGGPQAAILVEELATLGMSLILGLGAVGSLVDDLEPGAQVLASEAPALDGTSRGYTQDVTRPSAELLTLAQAEAQSLELSVRTSKVATFDALYHETEEIAASWIESGLDCVNMETAAFYAAARHSGVKALWLGHVTDKLVGSWNDWYCDHSEMVRDSCRLAERVIKASATMI